MRPAALVIFVLGVAVAAFLIGRDQSRKEREPGFQFVAEDRAGPEGVDTAAFERLSRSIDALQASVDRLTRRLDQWPERDSRPAGAPDRIVADRFELEAAPGAGAKPLPGNVPALLGGPPDPARRKSLDELKDKPVDEVSRAHWFWTYEDVIQRYGPPDEIHPVGEGYTINFKYTLGSDRNAVLSFYGGRLLYVSW